MTKRFFAGQPRIVSGSLSVFLSGIETAVSGVPDYDRGTFDLATAPSGSVQVQASYTYQWFTDAELSTFLTQGATMVGYESVSDALLPIGLRPALLDFSAYYAYMRMAAIWAESVTASAGGYTVDQSKSHPNWRALAEMALRAGQEKVKLFNEAPGDTKSPSVAFSKCYKVDPYIPST